jgi:ERCC4-type nuclease
MDLPFEAVTAVVDSREQLPLDLSPLRCVVGTLDTGDYSVVGLERIVSVERKSLPDLVACVGRERERFQRELDRLRAFPVRLLVVEASWDDLESGPWRGRVTPAAVVGSVLSWQAAGLPVCLAGDRERASRVVARTLYLSARKQWRLLSAFNVSLSERLAGSSYST